MSPAIASKNSNIAIGRNGQVELYANKIRIRRKGVLSFLTHGFKGDKDILLSTISAIQFNNASFVANGYIQFSFMGGQEAKGGLLQGLGDENSVLFNKKQQPAFERMKHEIEQRIQAKASTGKTFSDADELGKLADLRDRGILTEQEFQTKKTQILGL